MSSKAYMVIGWVMLIVGIASLYYFGLVYDTAPLADGSVRYVHNKAMIPQVDLSVLCEPVAPLDLSALYEPAAPLDLAGIGSCVKQDGIETNKETL